jgi:hypothetical protein
MKWFDRHSNALNYIDFFRSSNERGTPSVKIAILDTGIDLSQDNIALYNTEPRIRYQDRVDVDLQPKDETVHGTHLAVLPRKIAPNAILHVARVHVFAKRRTMKSSATVAKVTTSANSPYSLDHLTAPLNQHETLYTPTDTTNQSTSMQFNGTLTEGITRTIGLNARGLGNSTDAIYAYSRSKGTTYHCELLETLEFEPTKEFIMDSITASTRVQNTHSKALPGRKRVYMITGLKIATGFSTSTFRHAHHGPTLKVGVVQAAALGGPVSVGPEGELAATESRVCSQGRSINRIVFAYRVVRIKRKRDGEARWKYMDGGKYGMDDEDSEEEDDVLEVEALDEDDVGSDFPESVVVEMG